jgi:hypothetical protein
MTDIARVASRFDTGQTGPIEKSSAYVGATAVSGSAPLPAKLYVGTTVVSSAAPVPVVGEGVKAVYAYAATGITPAATPTDLVTLYGAASKIITVKKIRVHGLVPTTAGTMIVEIVKRTAANTAGTSTTPTPAKIDSADGAASAVLTQYSANASGLGTGISIAAKPLNMGVPGAAGVVEFDFCLNQEKPLKLKAATQGVAINFGGAAVPASGTLGYSIVWEEEAA